MHNKLPNIFTFISEFKKEEILKINKNIGIIFRNYKKKVDKKEILKIKSFCKTHNRSFFLANDLQLSINLNLDGAYIPSFNKSISLRKYKLKKNFLMMGSAHSLKEIKIKEKQNVELIFLSPLFKVKKSKTHLNIIKFNILSNLTKKKLIALGGINEKNIKMIKITNAYGYSGISYFKKPVNTFLNEYQR
tara:strand:+ start:23 stop:592 length:570 start_codon:yes stop_codon:yes gene_type:complete